MNPMLPNHAYFLFTPKPWFNGFVEGLPNASKIEEEELEMLEQEYLNGYSTETEKAFSNLSPVGMFMENGDQRNDEEDNNDEVVNYDDDDDEMDSNDSIEAEEEPGDDPEDDNSFQVAVLSSTSSESEVEDREQQDGVNPMADFYRRRREMIAALNLRRNDTQQVLNATMVTDESITMDSDNDDEQSPEDL